MAPSYAMQCAAVTKYRLVIREPPQMNEGSDSGPGQRSDALPYRDRLPSIVVICLTRVSAKKQYEVKMILINDLQGFIQFKK